MLVHRRSSSRSRGDKTGETGLYSALGDSRLTPTSSLPLAMDYVGHFTQNVQAFRPLMPSSCCFIDSEDVKLIGSCPVAAGGFADIWEATHDNRKVSLKSYRCYTSSDSAHIFEVH